MNGIKMSDCKFYVDEDARTVICVIPNTRTMLISFIRQHFQFKDINLYDAIDFWHGTFADSLHMPKSFMGKAVCAAEDEWDEETGKLLAFSRAKDKAYKSFFRRANNFVQLLDRRLGDMIEQFNNLGLRLENKRDGIQQKLNDILGTEE